MTSRSLREDRYRAPRRMVLAKPEQMHPINAAMVFRHPMTKHRHGHFSRVRAAVCTLRYLFLGVLIGAALAALMLAAF